MIFERPPQIHSVLLLCDSPLPSRPLRPVRAVVGVTRLGAPGLGRATDTLTTALRLCLQAVRLSCPLDRKVWRRNWRKSKSHDGVRREKLDWLNCWVKCTYWRGNWKHPGRFLINHQRNCWAPTTPARCCGPELWTGNWPKWCSPSTRAWRSTN